MRSSTFGTSPAGSLPATIASRRASKRRRTDERAGSPSTTSTRPSAIGASISWSWPRNFSRPVRPRWMTTRLAVASTRERLALVGRERRGSGEQERDRDRPDPGHSTTAYARRGRAGMPGSASSCQRCERAGASVLSARLGASPGGDGAARRREVPPRRCAPRKAASGGPRGRWRPPTCRGMSGAGKGRQEGRPPRRAPRAGAELAVSRVSGRGANPRPEEVPT